MSDPMTDPTVARDEFSAVEACALRRQKAAKPVLDQDEVRRRAEEALANALPSSPYNIPPMRVGFADPAMVGVGKPLEPEMRLVKYFFVEKTTDPYVWHDIASMVDCK